MMDSRRIMNASIWKFMERISSQAVQFIIQLILARLLLPSDYGALSIMLVFIAFANVLIQGGFNIALVQKEDAQEEDFSAIYLICLIVAIATLVILFFVAPSIEVFFNLDNFSEPFRVIIFILIPMALNSVQIARLQRDMDFKVIFIATLLSTIISGSTGIIFALLDLGIWALVIQQLTNYISLCLFIRFRTKLKIQLSIKALSLIRIKSLFSFSWKIMVANFIDTALTQIRTLIIGRKFSSADLGYYNRGMQFPVSVNTCFDGVIQSISLPIFSSKQKNVTNLKEDIRKSMKISIYIVAPAMIGLFVISEPLIIILLTEKWLPSATFLKIGCLIYLIGPLDTLNMQAIIAMGRSDIFLITGIIKRCQGVATLLIATFVFKSVFAIAIAALVSAFINNLINLIPNIFVIGYSFSEYIHDILPPILMSSVMGITIYFIGLIIDDLIYKIIIEFFLGMCIYFIMSVVIRPEGFNYLKKYKRK